MASSGPVLIAAGGTGGHLFPAEALAHALKRRDLAVHLVTDERAARYGGAFPADAVHVIKAATPTGGNLLARAWAVLTLIGVGLFVLVSIAERLLLPWYHTEQRDALTRR